MANVEARIFAVRHGEYDSYASDRNLPLTPAGIEQSRSTAEYIGDARAVIISSAATRALQTAEIIRQTMGVTSEVGKSRLLEEAGNMRNCISDLERLIRASIQEAQLVWNNDRTLVVVSHLPLVNAVKYGGDSRRRPEVGFGEVVEVDYQAWSPPDEVVMSGTTEMVDGWVEVVENGGNPWEKPTKELGSWARPMPF